MLSLFDSKNRDIKAIVDELANEHTGLTESAVSSAQEVNSTKEMIQESMLSHYTKAFGISDEDSLMGQILKEDAEGVGQMFINALVENGAVSVDPATGDITAINEATAVPFLHTLTASIAITQRIPYEATLHRVYDTRTLDKPTVEIEDVIPMVVAPGQEPEDLIDAFQPGKADADLFVNKTEIVLTDLLETGLTPGKECKNKDLVTGLDPLARIDRSMRLDHITLTAGSSLAGTTLRLQKGSTPYFSAREAILNVTYEAVDATTGEVSAEINISAAMDFERGILKYLTSDSEDVDKVFFYAVIEHSEHTHPIKMTYRNRFEQYTVPTRPHIEVSMPNETKTDISNMINYFADHDIVTAMTEQISVISSRMEDQRLYLGLKSGHMFEALFNFEPPTNFVHGNLEWLKREFIPFLDQLATRIKFDYNLDDCHFRVAVSPYILKILDTEHVLDKSLTEESRGSGLINYSIGVKTSTNVFYFISSQMMDTATGIMVLMPNQFKNSPVKTYNYFKYASFLTDTIRRSDNARMPAIVYSERNLPIVFDPVSSTMDITNMPITIESGDRWFIRKA
jgi:hypothetical protein